MIRVHVLRNDKPDVGNEAIPCCMGAAVFGAGGCTCWEPEYDQPQRKPKPGPMRQRTRKCADCAFRRGSPERRGDERYAHSEEGGLESALDGFFLCHTGMRKLVRERHPSGAVIEAMPDAYAPGSPPCKADGSPAEYCAGWAAERRRRAGALTGKLRTDKHS